MTTFDRPQFDIVLNRPFYGGQMDIHGMFQISNIGTSRSRRGHIGATFQLRPFRGVGKREIEALLQAAPEDTREDPDFDDPGDLDF